MKYLFNFGLFVLVVLPNIIFAEENALLGKWLEDDEKIEVFEFNKDGQVVISNANVGLQSQSYRYEILGKDEVKIHFTNFPVTVGYQVANNKLTLTIKGQGPTHYTKVASSYQPATQSSAKSQEEIKKLMGTDMLEEIMKNPVGSEGADQEKLKKMLEEHNANWDRLIKDATKQ